MFKFLILINLLYLLVSCNFDKSVMYGSYKGLLCEENNKSFKKYIFDINTGYLYFYSKNRDEFIPLNLRKEAGYFSEDDPEVFSSIKNNKLTITNIEYDSTFKEGSNKILRTINLDTLISKIVYINKNNESVYFKVRCTWIDPKSDMKIE